MRIACRASASGSASQSRGARHQTSLLEDRPHGLEARRLLRGRRASPARAPTPRRRCRRSRGTRRTGSRPASAVWGKEPEATREKRSSSVPSTAASDAVHLEALHPALAGRQEVARRDLGSRRPGAREELRRGPPVERVLQEAPAVQGVRRAVLLLEREVAAGLVVPHRVPAGPGFVDPVDLALQEERAAGRRDLDGLGRAERLVAVRAAEAERHLEEPAASRRSPLRRGGRCRRPRGARPPARGRPRGSAEGRSPSSARGGGRRPPSAARRRATGRAAARPPGGPS